MRSMFAVLRTRARASITTWREGTRYTTRSASQIRRHREARCGGESCDAAFDGGARARGGEVQKTSKKWSSAEVKVTPHR